MSDPFHIDAVSYTEAHTEAKEPLTFADLDAARQREIEAEFFALNGADVISDLEDAIECATKVRMRMVESVGPRLLTAWWGFRDSRLERINRE